MLLFWPHRLAASWVWGYQVLTRSVNSPVTLPSTRWNFPPLSASNIAGAWVKACTSCRKKKQVETRCMALSGIQSLAFLNSYFQRHHSAQWPGSGSILICYRPSFEFSNSESMMTWLQTHFRERMIPSGCPSHDPKQYSWEKRGKCTLRSGMNGRGSSSASTCMRKASWFYPSVVPLHMEGKCHNPGQLEQQVPCGPKDRWHLPLEWWTLCRAPLVMSRRCL